MTFYHYLFTFLGAMFLGALNSYYWYTQGHRGGKLFFLGTIAFFGIIMLILKLVI